MTFKKFLYPFLIVPVLLLTAGLGPIQAWASAHPAGLTRQGLVATVRSSAPIGPTFLIGDETVDTKNPAVAYNSQRQEYLVVWWNDRPGCDDIYGRRVSKNGAPIGPRFSIAAGCPGERDHPAVAYNSLANEYLVVWHLYKSLANNVLGQRISATGGLIGGAFNIAIGNGSTLEYSRPVVAYASIEDKYLVVFEHANSTIATCGIVAQALNSDGSTWGASFMVTVVDVPNRLSTGPDLTYNRLRNEFLVVWEQETTTLRDIAGRRVKMTGGAGTLGADFWIYHNSTSWDDLSPAVAAVPRSPDGQYLVVWEHYIDSTYGFDTWAQFVGGEGALEGTVFSIYSSTGCDCSPAVVGNESNQQYLVTWTSPVGFPPPNPPFVGIFERFISPAGGSYNSAPVWITGLFANHSAVANGPTGDILIAYEDTPSSSVDIWGRLVGNRVYLPLVVK